MKQQDESLRLYPAHNKAENLWAKNLGAYFKNIKICTELLCTCA